MGRNTERALARRRSATEPGLRGVSPAIGGVATGLPAADDDVLARAGSVDVDVSTPFSTAHRAAVPAPANTAQRIAIGSPVIVRERFGVVFGRTRRARRFWFPRFIETDLVRGLGRDGEAVRPAETCGRFRIKKNGPAHRLQGVSATAGGTNYSNYAIYMGTTGRAGPSRDALASSLPASQHCSHFGISLRSLTLAQFQRDSVYPTHILFDTQGQLLR